MTERDHRKYKFVDAQGKIIRQGITSRPLEVRQSELRRKEKKQRKGTPPGGRP